MFIAGQETGNAWSDVLFGNVNPSGRLPVTFPASEADTIAPCTAHSCEYSEGLHVGYRGLASKTVAFPFGHGLSYTNFSYSWHMEPTTHNCNNSYVACMEVKLSNIGKLDGSEVVQFYLDYPRTVGEPNGQLRGFNKVFLKSGSSTSLYFGLTSRHVSIWEKKWLKKNGVFFIHVGASSRDIRLKGQFIL